MVFFSYDLKNQIENLASENIDNLYFPLLNFFRPKYVFFKKEDFIEFQYLDDIVPADVISEILKIDIGYEIDEIKCNLSPRITKSEYLDIINKIQYHIKRGGYL